MAANDCTPPKVVALGFGNCEAATVPVMSAKAGCDPVGTPEVEIELIHWCEIAANDCTPPSVDELGFGSCEPLSVPPSRAVGIVPVWSVPVTSTVHRSALLAKLRKRSKFPVGEVSVARLPEMASLPLAAWLSVALLAVKE